VASPAQCEAGMRMREALSAYQQSEDLIQLGAYVAGTNPQLDSAIRARPQMLDFLRQPIDGKSPLVETVNRMQTLVKLLG
jgi:flagellar biosynthesis/type III secretory pathway ATPase